MFYHFLTSAQCFLFSLSPFHREALKRGEGMKFLLRNSEKTNWDICLTQTRCVSVRNSMCVSFKHSNAVEVRAVNHIQEKTFGLHSLLQCCSVAVLKRHSLRTLKILLYLYIYYIYNIYINIELIFDLSKIYFGTATLQRCNNDMIYSKDFQK